MTYDQWKCTDPRDDKPFTCERCEDVGCPECCETAPVTLEDMDEMDAQGALIR